LQEKLLIGPIFFRLAMNVIPNFHAFLISNTAVILKLIKGELRRKMNLWSNYTLLPSQPLSEICFHDCQMKIVLSIKTV